MVSCLAHLGKKNRLLNSDNELHAQLRGSDDTGECGRRENDLLLQPECEVDRGSELGRDALNLHLPLRQEAEDGTGAGWFGLDDDLGRRRLLGRSVT